MDIQSAVNRLNSQLPLKARQDKLPVVLKTLHKTVLTSLVKQGRPPTADELKMNLGAENIRGSLQRLGTDDLIVLDAEGKYPVGAYPVTSETTTHKIFVNGHTIHAMCALDALSVAPMFDAEVVIESSCRVSESAITIQMRGSKILEVQPSEDAVMVGVRWQMPLGVAAHSMCMDMVFLKDRPTAMAWQNNDSENTSIHTI